MDALFEGANVVPAVPAPPIASYPQFYESAIPEGSGASHAYRGFIRPFSDDANAKRVLRSIDAHQPLSVSSGRLDSDADHLPLHPLGDYLVNMAIPLTVVVLEFAGKRHPSAYLVDPLPVRRLSANAHIWWNKALIIDGEAVPELCIYSGNLFTYDSGFERLPQFLNQLSTYLAKHLIFLRTRMLHRLQKNGTARLVRKRRPEEPITLNSIKLFDNLLWFGKWVGKIAPNGSLMHLRTVDPNGECWCNSGEIYKNCHQSQDFAAYRRANSPYLLARY
jgi:hypothetical protein